MVFLLLVRPRDYILLVRHILVLQSVLVTYPLLLLQQRPFRWTLWSTRFLVSSAAQELHYPCAADPLSGCAVHLVPFESGSITRSGSWTPYVRHFMSVLESLIVTRSSVSAQKNTPTINWARKGLLETIAFWTLFSLKIAPDSAGLAWNYQA